MPARRLIPSAPGKFLVRRYYRALSWLHVDVSAILVEGGAVASRTYQNFDLLVESTATGYRARVVNSPTGESPSVDFTVPFDPVVLENLLLKLDPGRSGTRRVAQNPQVQAGRDFGGPLFDAVFAGGVALAWGRGQDAAGAAGNGVRLRLRLTDAPALAGLPWELLYDRRANAFLAQSERTPLVRYLDVPQVIRPLAVDGALRLLVVVSSPTDLPELDGDAEFARVTTALADRIASGQVVVDRLPKATVSELGQWLRTHDVHVLHFVGHGDFDTHQQDGVLYFCDSYDAARPSPHRCSGRSSTTTTRCASCCSTPAGPRTSTTPTPTAGWRRAWSSRTPPPWSPCSSRSATRRPCRSPATSTERWPTGCPSTRPSPAPGRPSTRTSAPSGPPRSCSCAPRTARCSKESPRPRRRWPNPRSAHRRPNLSPWNRSGTGTGTGTGAEPRRAGRSSDRCARGSGHRGP